MILKTMSKEKLEKLLEHINAEISYIERKIENYTEYDLYYVSQGMHDYYMREFLYKYRQEVYNLIGLTKKNSVL
jgi:DNA replication protein DnaD